MPLFETLMGLRLNDAPTMMLVASTEVISSSVRCQQSADEQEFLSLINGRRQTECPGRPLQFQPQMNQAAANQTNQMRSLSLADTQRMGLAYVVPLRGPGN
jgi:uncharacterized protein YkwD